MNNERNALKAGLFIIASLGLILAVIFSIRGVGQLLDRQRHLIVTFDLADDIGGLRIGDEVRIGGYMVGMVKNITLDTGQTTPHLQVLIGLPARYEIHTNADVRIQSSVTGVSVLNFESLGTGALLDNNGSIRGQASTLTQLAAMVSDVTPRFKSIAANLEQATSRFASSTLDKTETTIDKIATLADEGSALAVLAGKQINPDLPATIGHAARGMMQEIEDVIGQSKGDLRTSIANIAAATDALRQKTPEILEHFDQLLASVQKTVDGVNASLDDIQKTVVNTRELTAAARELLTSNRSRIDNMIIALRKTGDNLKNASAEIRRSPWRLLYKPAAGEMANLNLFDSARAFAEGAGELSDATQALRDALQSGQIDPNQLKTMLEQLDHSFNQFNTVENKLWQQVKQ